MKISMAFSFSVSGTKEQYDDSAATAWDVAAADLHGLVQLS
jgi:hypothetical protein